jgi:hypothetical protein
MTDISLSAGALAGSETNPDRENITSLRRMEVGVGVFSILLVVFSILLFLMDATCKRVSALIAEQNAAAVKLGVNFHYYESLPNKASTLPPGLLEDAIEFSRRNAIIIETAQRLSPMTLFSSASVSDLIKRLQASDGSGRKLEHISIDPTKYAPNDVVAQGQYQLQLFQAIRDAAHDQSGLWAVVIAGISAYLLPVIYAVLGAFLYEFRTWCKDPSKRKVEIPPDRMSRFLMAGIAGIAISAFNDLFPKEILLPPLAIAFIVGYSIDVFTSRLDALIRNLKPKEPLEASPMPAPPAKVRQQIHVISIHAV